MTTPANELNATVSRMLGYLGVQAEVSVIETGAGLAVAIEAPAAANLLIGRDGQNLKAFEQVLRAMWSRHAAGQRTVSVDVNGYRKDRDQELAKNVHTVAQRVRETRRPEALNPMNPYERRIVHTELAAYHDLASESVGQEPHRRVVVRPL